MAQSRKKLRGRAEGTNQGASPNMWSVLFVNAGRFACDMDQPVVMQMDPRNRHRKIRKYLHEAARSPCSGSVR